MNVLNEIEKVLQNHGYRRDMTSYYSEMLYMYEHGEMWAEAYKSPDSYKQLFYEVNNLKILNDDLQLQLNFYGVKVRNPKIIRKNKYHFTIIYEIVLEIDHDYFCIGYLSINTRLKKIFSLI